MPGNVVDFRGLAGQHEQGKFDNLVRYMGIYARVGIVNVFVVINGEINDIGDCVVLLLHYSTCLREGGSVRCRSNLCREVELERVRGAGNKIRLPARRPVNESIHLRVSRLVEPWMLIF